MRIVIAGLIGGIVLFVWSMLAHVVLLIGELGMKVASNQDVTISTLQAAADKGPGVYMIPGMAPEQWQDDAAMQAFVEKYKAAPSAFVVYDPSGNPSMSNMVPNLVKQFIGDYFIALLAAWIMASGAFSFGTRVAMGAAMGLIAWLSANVPYWNWYRFPMDFTIGAWLDYGLGLLIASIAMAWWLGRGSKRA